MGKGSKKGIQLPNPQRGKTVTQMPDGRGAKTASQFLRWAEARPSWRVKILQMRDPFGWHRVRPRKQQDILSKLAAFETMTWSQILIGAKSRNHSVAVDQLCNEARKELRVLGLEDMEELVSLRLTGEERVWGYIDEMIFHLIWWDPKHMICPSMLKHT